MEQFDFIEQTPLISPNQEHANRGTNGEIQIQIISKRKRHKFTEIKNYLKKSFSERAILRRDRETIKFPATAAVKTQFHF